MALPRITLGGVDVFKEWRASLAFLMGISGSGRIKVDATPNGKRASLSHDGKRFARLSGATNPYTATEVYPSASGGWDDAADSPTFTPVYDDWDQDGLDDKVVEIRPDAGEWRFLYKRVGDGDSPPPPPCDVDITVLVRGSCAEFPLFNYSEGVTVRAFDGATELDSGVTGADGRVTLTISAPSFPMTVTIAVDDFCGYEGPSTELGLTACVDRFVSFMAEPDLDHVCCWQMCEYPIPKTLYFTCDSGTATLVHSSGSWVGTLSFTGRGSYISGDTFICHCPARPGVPAHDIERAKFSWASTTLNFPIRFDCPGALTVSWTELVGETGCHSCDWAYGTPDGWANADSWFGPDCVPTEPTTITCEGCNTFLASGEVCSSPERRSTIFNCEHETLPEPEECFETIPNPIGSWTVSS